MPPNRVVHEAKEYITMEKTRRRGRNRRSTKDRVLQARIPEHLDDELRNRAGQLGLSVSTIVRNILLHTFDLVEGVVTDSTQIAKALTGWDGAPATGRSTLLAKPTAESNQEVPVIGWQEAILNRNGVCETCNAILPVGERAAIGVPTGSRVTLLCLECLSALSSSPDSPDKMLAPKKDRRRSSKSTSTGTKKTAN
jgi:hypothetical protein